MTKLLTALRAAAENTRLRILSILRNSELTVSELVEVLGQSQPRVSRHLKLLCDSGLLQRYQEGAWVFHRLADSGSAEKLANGIVDMIDVDDPDFAQDRERLKVIKARNAARASQYFSKNAAEWDSIRQMSVPDRDIENSLVDSLDVMDNGLFLDLGTGTGRMLQIFSPWFKRCIGIDLSREMLQVARSNLDSSGVTNCTVRQNDINSLPFDNDFVDAVTIHQVLHYIDQPDAVIAESARVMKPGAQLIVVDFLPHDLEFLREKHAHLRLGISEQAVANWAAHCGLTVTSTRYFHPDHSRTDSLDIGVWYLKK
jgi:ArsR family transcriptional regulator